MHIKWIFLFGCLIFFLSNCENVLVRRTTRGGNSGNSIRNRSGYSPKQGSVVSSSKGTNYYRGTTRYQPRLASAPPPPPPPPPPPAALHGGNYRRPGNKRPIQPIAKPMVASPAITKIGVVPTFHSAPKFNASRPLYTAQHGNGRRNNTQQWSQTKVNASRPLYPAQHGNGRRNNTQQWPQTRINTNATSFGGNVRRNNTQQWPQMRPRRVGSNYRNTSLNAFPYNTRPNMNFTRNATHIGAGGRSSTPAQVTTNEIIPKVFVGSQNSAPPPSNPSVNINVNVPGNGQQKNPEKSNKKTNWVSQAWKGIKDKFNSNPKKETRTTITHSLAKGPSNHVVETFADCSWDDVNADVRLAGTTKSAQKSITNKILIFSGCAVLVLLAVSLIAYFYARNRRSADLN
ncbi:R3H domain-containing protein 1-like isoform X2 [Musca domestica]|uniref:R3H domain-containing protein 1-like isoform X2 n=1 Tax=Musca domestica TaxID=7370 RepID=A0ABM3VIC3_MUSDO|nr:R3H domain-containing protein 1-like isoform X2 [Musca domestica]